MCGAGTTSRRCSQELAHEGITSDQQHVDAYPFKKTAFRAAPPRLPSTTPPLPPHRTHPCANAQQSLMACLLNSKTIARVSAVSVCTRTSLKTTHGRRPLLIFSSVMPSCRPLRNCARVTAIGPGLTDGLLYMCARWGDGRGADLLAGLPIDWLVSSLLRAAGMPEAEAVHDKADWIRLIRSCAKCMCARMAPKRCGPWPKQSRHCLGD